MIKTIFNSVRRRLLNSEKFLNWYNSSCLKKADPYRKMWVIKYYEYLEAGKKRKDKKAVTPEILILMLNTKCNLQCKFCDVIKNQKEMGFENVKSVVDNVKNLGVHTIVITGGEPLMHPQFFEIVNYIKDNGLRVSLTTNGMLVDTYLENIKGSNIDAVCVSIDGLEKTHDSLRDCAGSHSRIMNNIMLLKENNIHVEVKFVVTNENVRELEVVYNHFKVKGIKFDFWPVNIIDKYYLRDEDKEIFVDFISRLFERGEISRFKYDYYLKGLKYHDGKLGRVRCLGFNYYLGIDVDGNIMPCCVWGKKSLVIGNVFKDNLAELWDSDKAYLLRDRIFCHGCDENCFNHSLWEFSEITKKDFEVKQ